MNTSESFDFSFLSKARDELEKLGPENILGRYEVSFPEGLSTVPILELCSIFEAEPSFNDKVRVTRHCILDKNIEIKFDGKPLETIRVTDFNVDFNAFKIFKDHPFALMFLVQTCFLAVVKNSIPLSKSTSAPKAEEG